MRTFASGFSLMELVIVTMVTSILSAVVAVSVNSGSDYAVTAQADPLRRDLSHMQLLAISGNSRLKLTLTSTGYSVCSATAATCNAANAITDPATGSAFSRNFQNNVSAVSGTGTYYFDSLGRPASASTGATLNTSRIQIALNGVGRSTDALISVEPVTGFASATY